MMNRSTKGETLLMTGPSVRLRVSRPAAKLETLGRGVTLKVTNPVWQSPPGRMVHLGRDQKIASSWEQYRLARSPRRP
jgi:hypothetical protein